MYKQKANSYLGVSAERKGVQMGKRCVLLLNYRVCDYRFMGEHNSKNVLDFAS